MMSRSGSRLALSLAVLLAGCAPSAGRRTAPPAPPALPGYHPAATSSPAWEPPVRKKTAARWVRIDVGTKAALLAVHFPTPKRGWIVGRKGLVLATSDGGRTWKRQESGIKKADLYAVHFIDAKRGWACGGPGDGPRARGHVLMGGDMSAAVLLRTSDGGRTWKKTWVPTNFTLTGIWMLDAKRGLITSHGGVRHPDGDTVTSFDGGKSWRTRRAFRALHAVRFVDGKTGFAAGTPVVVGFMPRPRDPLYLQKTSLLIKTTDGGRTWKPLKHPKLGARDQLTGLSFADPRTGWACGSRGAILRTSDGGVTWTVQKSGSRQPLRDVFALSAEEAWAFGYSGTVLHTVDGGRSWKKVPCGSAAHLRRAWFTSPTHGVAVGLGGTVLLYGP